MQEALREEHKKIQEAQQIPKYEHSRSSLKLPQDTELHDQAVELAQTYADAHAVVIIGIGGSNLGAKALHQAINGNYADDLHTPRAYFADTIDSQDLIDLQASLKRYYAENKRVVLVAISKSGTTTETIANLQLLIQAHKQHNTNWHEDVVIITGEESKLDAYAKKHEISTLPIPSGVGGRYSVLSPVGTFVLSLLDIDTQKLLQGAQTALNTQKEFPNDVSKQAEKRLQALSNGLCVHELFIFNKQLQGLGEWTRQLYAESLGKDDKGFTPTTAIGSTDLHSLAQLRLDGDDHTYTTFLTIEEQPTIKLEKNDDFEQLVQDLQQKPLADVLRAIQHGTTHAYTVAKREYNEIQLPIITEEHLGYFMQERMIETMYLAAGLGVNAFTQPAVESYKTRTKEHLKKSSQEHKNA